MSEFVWTGAADYAPLLAVSAALRSWRQLGPEAVRAHQRELLRAATELLATAWDTGGSASGLLKAISRAPCAGIVSDACLAGMGCSKPQPNAGFSCPTATVPVTATATATAAGLLVPLDMCGGGMALVQLPPGCVAAARAADAASSDDETADIPAGKGTASSADAKWVQDSLHYKHLIECPVKCIAGLLYVRISGVCCGSRLSLSCALRVFLLCASQPGRRARQACQPHKMQSTLAASMRSIAALPPPLGPCCSAPLQRAC